MGRDREESKIPVHGSILRAANRTKRDVLLIHPFPIRRIRHERYAVDCDRGVLCPTLVNHEVVRLATQMRCIPSSAPLRRPSEELEVDLADAEGEGDGGTLLRLFLDEDE